MSLSFFLVHREDLLGKLTHERAAREQTRGFLKAALIIQKTFRYDYDVSQVYCENKRLQYVSAKAVLMSVCTGMHSTEKYQIFHTG